MKTKLWIAALLLCGSLSFGATQGPLTPGTGADASDVGTAVWSNPTRITACDQSNATAFLGNDGIISHDLAGSNFGFTLPAASVGGIKISWFVAGDSATAATDSGGVFISASATWGQGTNKSNGTTWCDIVSCSPTAIDYGGSSDKWGQTWTVAQLNSSNFTAFLSAIPPSGGAGTAIVDCVQATVTYTLASSPRRRVIQALLFGHPKPKVFSQTSYAKSVLIIPKSSELLFGKEFQLGF